VRKFPEPIQNLAAALVKLPGVGPKTALRYVFALLKLPPHELTDLTQLIHELGERIKTCRECLSYTDNGVCTLCQDPRRDVSALCIVETSRDIPTLEATGVYQGRYFVLGGILNPIEGMTPEALNVKRLLNRLERDAFVQEIILALSPDVLGETTMMYLAKQLKPFGRRLTKLARGLPTGASLEFADEITLGDALKGRRDA
jgi:recombination protein RecR